MIDYQPLISHWRGGALEAWAAALPEQVAAGLSRQRYGDLPRWLEALEALPDLQADEVILDAARVGTRGAAPPGEVAARQLR